MFGGIPVLKQFEDLAGDVEDFGEDIINEDLEGIEDMGKETMGLIQDLVGYIQKEPELDTKRAAGHIPSFQILQRSHSENRYAQQMFVQAKLEIGQIKDAYEQEADRVADAIMQMSEPASNHVEELFQIKKLLLSGMELSPDFEAQFNLLRGGGRPLPESVRTFFESRLGFDFSQVRIHTEARGVELARTLNARAFTVGQDVVFGAGQYATWTSAGQRLLAHELVHVIQQSRDSNAFGERMYIQCAGYIDSTLQEVLKGEKVLKKGEKGPAVEIIQQALISAGVPLPKFGADGDFGGETDLAVRSFQESNGLLTNGVVDLNIIKILAAIFPQLTALMPELSPSPVTPPYPVSPSPPPSDGFWYTVKSGDWLDGIAKSNGLSSWKDIYYHEKNKPHREKYKDPNKLYPGDKLWIPTTKKIENSTPKSTPKFLTIEQPNTTNYVQMHDLFAYMATFQHDNDTLQSVRIFTFNQGKLSDVNTKAAVPIECGKDVYFYFSHRGDLIEPSRQKVRFHINRMGLPLIGPVRIPCGNDPELRVNIWDQKDWFIVHNVDVDQGRFDAVKMADWQDRYSIGYYTNINRNDKPQKIFKLFYNYDYKDKQESWKGVTKGFGRGPIPLLHWGNPNNIPMYIGTLSVPPKKKLKILLMKNGINVGSYNEIKKGSDNLERNGHHQFNQLLVARLMANGLESPGPDQNALIDKLPNPPMRFLLPGDMCWNYQGHTPNCGAFSFAAAMNYWYPYINNPANHNGTWFCDEDRVPSIINGARTPDNIKTAAERFQMYGKYRNAEKLDRIRAFKLIKLWLTAGIPILFLSKEESEAGWWKRLWSYHWKVLVGYDMNAFFMNNSGGNQEGKNLTLRDSGFDYDHAPIGNNSNSENNFWKKWKASGGDIVDNITSVNECTFVPIYPKNINFSGSSPK